MKDNFNKNLGAILKKYRKENNYTLEDISSKLNKSKSWLGDIESGRNRIYFDDIKKICDIYNIELDTLVKDIEYKNTIK